MATCCSVTFVIFTFIAMSASIASVYFPLFIFVDSSGSINVNPGSGSSASSMGGEAPHTSAIALHVARAFGHAVVAPNEQTKAHGRKTFHEQFLPLPDGSMQCPFFDGPCRVDQTTIPLTTDEVLAICGCSDKIGSKGDASFPRFWSIVSSSLSGLVFASGIFHMIGSSNVRNRGAVLKFGVAGIAGAHVAVSAISVVLQSRITPCLTNSPVVQLALGGSTLIMISLIVEGFACAVMFFCALGMALSWCMTCCGAPPGNQVIGNQQMQIQMVNNAYSPYPVGNEYPAVAYGNLPPPAQNPAYTQPPYGSPTQQYKQQY
jgi:hypothetical protein